MSTPFDTANNMIGVDLQASQDVPVYRSFSLGSGVLRTILSGGFAGRILSVSQDPTGIIWANVGLNIENPGSTSLGDNGWVIMNPQNFNQDSIVDQMTPTGDPNQDMHSPVENVKKAAQKALIDQQKDKDSTSTSDIDLITVAKWGIGIFAGAWLIKAIAPKGFL